MRALAAAVVAAVVLSASALPVRAEAFSPGSEGDAPRLDSMALGPWQGHALADPASGAFAACVVGIADRDGGAALNFWMGGDGNLRVHLHAAGLALEPGAAVPLELSFNGSRRRAETTLAEAVSEQALALADGEEMERRFRRSRSAEFVTPFGRVGFGLRSSNQALRWLERCAARFATAAPVAVATAVPEPAPTPEPEAPVITHLDAAVLLANGLSTAAVAGFAIDTAPEEATVRFTAPAGGGWIRALHPGEVADLEALRFDLLAETAAACRGRYGADNRTAGGAVALRLSTSCEEGSRLVRELAVLTGTRGSLVATVEAGAPDPAMADALFSALAAGLGDEVVAADAAAAPAATPEIAEPVDAAAADLATVEATSAR